MLYTTEEYAEHFPKNGKRVSKFTILRMIANNQLPSNHKVKRGKQFMIEVVSHCDTCQAYFDASVEYHRRKKTANDYELAAEISVKYNILITKLFKMQGL